MNQLGWVFFAIASASQHLPENVGDCSLNSPPSLSLRVEQSQTSASHTCTLLQYILSRNSLSSTLIQQHENLDQVLISPSTSIDLCSFHLTADFELSQVKLQDV